jgi:hypothetical protein
MMLLFLGRLRIFEERGNTSNDVIFKPIVRSRTRTRVEWRLQCYLFFFDSQVEMLDVVNLYP